MGGSLGMVQFTLESPGFEVSQAALFWCRWSPGAVCQANEAIAGGHSGIALVFFFSNTISRLPANHGESIHFGVSHWEYWYWMILIYTDIYILICVYIYIYIESEEDGIIVQLPCASFDRYWRGSMFPQSLSQKVYPYHPDIDTAVSKATCYSRNRYNSCFGIPWLWFVHSHCYNYNLKDSFSRVSGTARPKFSSKPC